MPLLSQSESRAAVTRTRSTERGQVERRRAASSTRSGSISRQSPNDRRFGSRAPSADDRNPNRASSAPKSKNNRGGGGGGVSTPPKSDPAELRFRKAQQAQAKYEMEERAKQQERLVRRRESHSNGNATAGVNAGVPITHHQRKPSVTTAVSKTSSSQHAQQHNNNKAAANVPPPSQPPSKYFVMSPEVATAIQMTKLRGGIPTTNTTPLTAADQEQLFSRRSSYRNHQDSSAAHHHHKSSAPLLQHQSDEDGNATDDGEGFGFSSSTTPQAPPAPPHITQGEIASMRSTVELCRVIGRHQTYVDDLQDSLAAYETATQEERDSCVHFKHDRATRRAKITEDDKKRRQRMSVVNKQILILEKENKALQLQLYDEGY